MGNLLITALIALALSACGAPSTPDFMQKAAVSDMYEIESGKLAIQKGQSDPVIKFGQKMMDDHGNATGAESDRQDDNAGGIHTLTIYTCGGTRLLDVGRSFSSKRD